ncbi:MAG: DNA topoisomerase I [Candidatus Pacearchaeota archaeon]|nr:MAG: DNA topoisomerase I [Candidatus Pacearchaeota archaeon]
MGKRKINFYFGLATDKYKIGSKMTYTLIIAEKPAAAMRIAYALAEIAPVKRNIAGVPFWEINRGKKKFIIVSAVGHLFGLAQKGTSKEWPVFDIEWQASKGFVRKYMNVITHFAKEADNFIIACDYDIEGELIGFNALRFLCKKEDAKRMKFSTLTKPDLIKSYEDIMAHIDFGQVYAGETRHFLDWYYGINLSRALMQAIKKAGSFRILSIGRVQGPALALIVEKEKKIQAFKPEPYWQIFLLVKNKHEIEVKYPKDIIKEKELKIFEKLKGKTGEARTTKEEKSLRPFPPFDLTSLQIESYKFFGITPAQTLSIAQKLYLQGLISYPRTSSQKLPFTIGYKRILNKLNRLFPKLTAYAKRAMPIEGRKTDPAHPSIFPTGEKSKKLNQAEKQVYDLIVKRFIACFSEDAFIEEKKISVKVGKHEFIVQGKKILKKEWLNVYPAKIDVKEIPDLDGKVKVKDVRIDEKETQPPRRYSASSLVYELEKRGLGTKGTRAMIVDTLYKRGYITGRQIQATKLGMNVVSALEKNSPLILDEKLTRKFEEEMEKIRGEKTKEKIVKKEKKVIDEAKDLLIKISKQFKEHEKEIGKELLAAHKEIVEEQRKANTLFLCPVCKKGHLVMLRSRRGKRFAGCDAYPKCKNTYALPQYGLIKLAGKKCKECDFQLLLLIRKSKPPWEFCFNPECKTRKVIKKVRRQKPKARKPRKLS